MRTLSPHRGIILATPWLLACAVPGDPEPAGAGASSGGEALAVRSAPLDAAPRTIPYGGYVDFDGEPVNAGSVDFNFALFPCATPGTADGQCAPLWVAKGTWNDAASDWTQGWPAGASDVVELPIFSGRFTVELGAAGQNPLPDALYQAGVEVAYLAIRIEGRALSSLQKIAPASRTRVAERAYVAESADQFTVREDLGVGGKLDVTTDLTVGGASTLAGDVEIQGTAQVSGDLEVGGALRFGGRTIGRIIKCGRVAIGVMPSTSNPSRYYHYWQAGDCDGGLPTGTCLGFLTRANANGADQDWEVVVPGQDPTLAGGPATNGGMAWWNGSGDIPGFSIAAVYMCEE
ncbi:MAG: hypothetical protein IT385_06690 [Deltaproteobacteria bacterium]|nr:hypothetical protein [Deltaproteobacteria bacterium]